MKYSYISGMLENYNYSFVSSSTGYVKNKLISEITVDVFKELNDEENLVMYKVEHININTMYEEINIHLN